MRSSLEVPSQLRYGTKPARGEGSQPSASGAQALGPEPFRQAGLLSPLRPGPPTATKTMTLELGEGRPVSTKAMTGRFSASKAPGVRLPGKWGKHVMGQNDRLRSD